MNKNILYTAIGLTFVGGLLGIKYLGSMPEQTTNASAQIKPKTKLLADEDVGHPAKDCLPSGVIIREVLGVLDQYSIVAYKHDFDLLEQQDKEDGYVHLHDYHEGPEPNLDFAIMVIDPTVGCKPTTKSVRAEGVPQTLDKGLKSELHYVIWNYRAIVLSKEHQTELQDYLDDRLYKVGPGYLRLGEFDVKALVRLNMKLPDWYNLKLSEEQRDKARDKHIAEASTKAYREQLKKQKKELE